MRQISAKMREILPGIGKFGMESGGGEASAGLHFFKKPPQCARMNVRGLLKSNGRA